MALLLGAAGCSSGVGGPGTGHAIRAEGPLPTGTLGFPDVKQGDVFQFSFPLLNNTSKSPVTVTSWKVVTIPAGVKVIRYAVYSYDDTPGYLTAGYSSDFKKYPDYEAKPIVIAPGKQSHRYPSVRVQVAGKITSHLHGCEIDYEQKGHSYQQVLDCDYALDGT